VTDTANTPPAEPQPNPSPVQVDANLFDLKASPTTIEGAAQSWRRLQKATHSAQETTHHASTNVLRNGWHGKTADAYDHHRRALTRDLDKLVERAGTIATTLDELAEVLRVNQEALLQQRERLAGIPVTGGSPLPPGVRAGSGSPLVFQPADAKQQKLVTDAIRAANEIRSHVDQRLVSKHATLVSAQTHLAALAETWQPRSITLLNLNMGQGHANSPRDTGGTDHGDIGSIANTIANSRANVVTLQEMMGQDTDDLERELRRRTGQNWKVHFGEASKKVYWGDGYVPRGFHEPFGNAIAVRTGDAIAGSEYVANHKLDPPGNTFSTPSTPHPPSGQPASDGEGRSALQVQLNFRGN
jgi:uncharacterized protein YukE